MRFNSLPFNSAGQDMDIYDSGQTFLRRGEREDQNFEPIKDFSNEGSSELPS